MGNKAYTKQMSVLDRDKLFPLGFGCMRFPRSNAACEELLLHAVSEGVNYFDTALMYGSSESRLGKILEKHGLRERVNIATKVPPAFIQKAEHFERYFNQSLNRLRTDYIDYYLIHMISDLKMWERLVQKGVIDWVTQQKTAGRIRHFGFSFHGGREEFERVIDAYDWDFCLIQYNYLDKHSQASNSELHYAHSKGIPVFVMSPLKGGRLVDSLPKTALDIFARPRTTKESTVQWTPEEWAFRWLWNQPEVACVLSGMNSMDQLRENICIAKTSHPGMLTPDDHDIIAAARQAITDATKVSCTACNYCLPCPQNVDIPTCLISYNNIEVAGKWGAARNYFMNTSLKAKPQVASLCNHCGRCEAKCPQSIEIRKELDRVKDSFEKFYFKPIIALARQIMKVAK
jgi:predicted aldo/keto reductase-like oxidoreductase